MRTLNEIVHEDMNTIEFTMIDNKTNLTARQLVDLSQFMSLDTANKEEIRRRCNSELNRILDKESKEA